MLPSDGFPDLRHHFQQLAVGVLQVLPGDLVNPLRQVSLGRYLRLAVLPVCLPG